MGLIFTCADCDSWFFGFSKSTHWLPDKVCHLCSSKRYQKSIEARIADIRKTVDRIWRMI